MSKNKVTVRSSVGSQKQTSAGREIDVDYKCQYFNWTICTKYLDEEHEDFCLLRSMKEFKKIIVKLDDYRTWQWSEIERSYNKLSTGTMDIAKLDSKIKAIVENHLVQIKKDYIDQLYKIEINNHHRVWGIREGSCLFLIWNDPEHRFYKHQNKNYTASKVH